jgi:hypothetical protein
MPGVKRVFFSGCLVAGVLLGVLGVQNADAQTFMRADSNSDASVDITDPLFTLFYSFLGSTEPSCMDAADANDDGTLDITDTFYTLSYLFVGNIQLPAPGTICGPDDSEDSLDCAEYSYCDGISGISTFETPIQSLGSFGRGGDGDVLAADGGVAPGAAPPGEAGQGVDPGAAGQGEVREIEEADVYKLDGSTLYIMNRYRGLQIVDLSDLENPELVGQVEIFGWPQEMYVRGNTAYILVTDYFQFDVAEGDAGSSIVATPFYGSQLRIIDISDPTQPEVTGSIRLDGNSSDSRLVGDVIYVIAHQNPWSWFEDTATPDQTLVTSVSVGDASSVDVIDQEGFPRNGWEHHVHVNQDTIYLASSGYTPENNWRSFETNVQYVDISDAGGDIAVRDDIDIRGRVQDRWQMDEHNGILRIASAESWGNGDVYVTTLGVTNPDALSRIGEGVLSVDERLTAARFDGDEGYVVTYRNIDPLFTVDLSDPTNPTFPGELVMTGWLDFIVPVGSRNQLVALGHEDVITPEGGRQISLSVSLIDVANQSSPLLQSRAVLDGIWGWVPGERDDFAKVFRTLPNEELILFPFTAWDRSNYRSFGGVQLIDWKPLELDLRGVIETPGFWVERGIPVEDDTVLTLSSEYLQSANILDRDNPNILGSLELARNVQQFDLLPGDEHAVQLSGNWYRGDARLTVTSRDEPNDPSPLSQIEIAAPYGRMFTNESLVYVASSRNIYNGDGLWTGQTTVIEAFDLTDPLNPQTRGSVELPEPVSVGQRYWYWGSGDEVVQVDGTTLAFHRYQYPFHFWDCFACGDALFAPPGEMKHEIYLVDMSDADNPHLASTVTIDDADWSWGLKSSGDLLYISSYRSFFNEDHWLARYFLHRIDIADVENPVTLPGVNIPGMFVDATPDGGTIYTHETRYDHVTYESHNLFHALALVDDAAFLQSSVEIPGYPNSFMVEDDAAFTTTYRSETITELDGSTQWVSHSDLIAIDLRQRDDISVASTTEVPFNYAYLQKVEDNRAFVGSWPGIFVYDVEDIDAPSFEGFFRTQGWSQDILVDSNRAWVPTGFYGVRILELE